MTNERRKEIREIRKQRNKQRKTNRNRKKRPNKFVRWFKRLKKWQKVLLISVVVLLLVAIGIGCYVLSKFSKLDRQDFEETEIYINEELDETVGEGYTNFVLFGGDSRSGNVKRNLNTDSIIICSLNNETKEVRLISVYRDTLLDVGDGNIRKCNSAYALGGPKQAINMLNKNLDLDIKKYVTVNFKAVSDLVDMLGGIEADISQAEMYAMNRYIKETARLTGKKSKNITKTGVQTLDGVQATTYARIRKGVGDDYKRTERQRYVIQKVVEKAIQNPSAINKIIDKLFPQISTNFTLAEILSYAMSAAKYKIVETSGFPMVKGSGMISGRGSCVYPITLKDNVTMLHEFLFGTKDYQPSSKVVSISGDVAYVVSQRPVTTTNKDDGDKKDNGATQKPDNGGNTGGDSGAGDNGNVTPDPTPTPTPTPDPTPTPEPTPTPDPEPSST